MNTFPAAFVIKPINAEPEPLENFGSVRYPVKKVTSGRLNKVFFYTRRVHFLKSWILFPGQALLLQTTQKRTFLSGRPLVIKVLLNNSRSVVDPNPSVRIPFIALYRTFFIKQ